MKFEKGNKLGGRTKGSNNKLTQDIRKAFKDLLANNLEAIEEDFKSLEPKDRIKLFLDMSKFVLPTLKQVEATIERDCVVPPSIKFTHSREAQETIYKMDDNELESFSNG